MGICQVATAERAVAAREICREWAFAIQQRNSRSVVRPALTAPRVDPPKRQNARRREPEELGERCRARPKLFTALPVQRSWRVCPSCRSRTRTLAGTAPMTSGCTEQATRTIPPVLAFWQFPSGSAHRRRFCEDRQEPERAGHSAAQELRCRIAIAPQIRVADRRSARRWCRQSRTSWRARSGLFSVAPRAAPSRGHTLDRGRAS